LGDIAEASFGFAASAAPGVLSVATSFAVTAGGAASFDSGAAGGGLLCETTRISRWSVSPR
jgi:hypothetical protein